MINPAVDELAEHVTVKRACELTGRPRGSHYRAKQPRLYGPPPKRPSPPNALTEAEQAQVLEALTSERFCDKSVTQTWATLLDEGTYLCSMSTMHRLLRAHGAAGERRRQATRAAILLAEMIMVSFAVVRGGAAADGTDLAAPSASMTNVEAIGRVLYTDYIYFFQAAGIVLLIAMIGAITLTLRHKPHIKRQNIADQVNRPAAKAMEVKSVQTGQGVSPEELL